MFRLRLVGNPGSPGRSRTYVAHPNSKSGGPCFDAGVDVARRVHAGTYGVNTYTMDFAAPFGGYKASGIGPEFGPEGLAHYTEVKSIYTPLPEG